MHVNAAEASSIRLFCEVAREAIAIDSLPEVEQLRRLERLADNLEFVARVIPAIADERFALELNYVGNAIANLQAKLFASSVESS